MALFSIHDRQRRIPGWRQEAFEKARITVHGRGWLGAFIVLGLRALGVGEITWVGSPRPETEGLARFAMRGSGSRSESAILAAPLDVESAPLLAWALEGRSVEQYVCVTDAKDEMMLGLEWADRKRVPALAGGASGGGWLACECPADAEHGPQDPVLAMIVAAQMVDVIRERICGVFSNPLTALGRLDLKPPSRSPNRLGIHLVGVGGIGVWAAIALAAAHGEQLTLDLWDDDLVATENLNRQMLFTEADAIASAPKAEAARRSLAGIFPGVQLRSVASRVGLEHLAEWSALTPRPDVILSAVDNARTRLALQDLGRALRVPVVQGGTAMFMADCFTQTANGPMLDQQMHGALVLAADREDRANREPGGCIANPSYVVPGMMAGALMAYQVDQLGLDTGHAHPIRWRSGHLPSTSSVSSSELDFDFFRCLHAALGAS